MSDKKVDLDTYATQYDNMTRFKPSYHRVQNTTVDYLATYLKNKVNPVIGDFGAGTGELSKRVIGRFPESTIYAVELNPGFYKKLSDKVGEFSGVEAKNGNIEETLFPKDYFDAIAMMHVLNYTANAKVGVAIKRAYEQLKPEGIFVIADIGRVLNMKTHAHEMFKCAYSELGLIGTAVLYFHSLQVLKQNRIFRKNQLKGIHPLHDLESFVKLVESFGFETIIARDDLYLGDDDYVVARKPS
jgi:ubiquinone/menaquinone biosynthesis C-methylase UbiE